MSSEEWTIDGGHFAERGQGCVIALGESIVVIEGGSPCGQTTSSTR